MTVLNLTHLALRFCPKKSCSAAVPRNMRLILSLLEKLHYGALRIDLPNGQSHHFGDGAAPMHLVLHNWNLAHAVLKSGDIGLAETYMAGDWSVDDLPGLIALFARNRALAESIIYGTWWGNLLYRVKHLLRRNTRAGSRKNIHAHYDIGNSFYELWLDASMTYSSAVYRAPQDCLAQAQQAKYQRIIEQLQLSPGQRVLEIGCGWGGFAECAIATKQVHLTGLTLATEQLHYARRRLAQAGLDGCSDLRLQDYRDVEGEFDAIASIEMFEAVGQAYWPSYFACLARCLKPAGRACVQTIVIAETLFERYQHGTDFIQQYIFPGGMLPTAQRFCAIAEQHGLRVLDSYHFAQDYARTLAQWRGNFLAALPQVRAQGFDERFIRTWDFYLAYCQGGFSAGSIDVVQFTLEKR